MDNLNKESNSNYKTKLLDNKNIIQHHRRESNNHSDHSHNDDNEQIHIGEHGHAHNDNNGNHDNNDMSDKAKRKLIIVCFVCTIFMAIEFFGGLMANSLAIMTDAAHLLSDLMGFIISIYAIHISKSASNKNLTFGYHRAEIVGALGSVFIIWILTILLLIESMTRIFDTHHKVEGGLMLLTSTLGLVFNGFMAYILHSSVYKIFYNKILLGRRRRV
jgi:Co/Zn/Cd efflux system component